MRWVRSKDFRQAAPTGISLPFKGQPLQGHSGIKKMPDGSFWIITDNGFGSKALVAAHPLLAAAARIEDVKTSAGLNIEALEITPDRQRLFIGFRSPLQGRLAVIASIDNPTAIFEADAAPQVSGTLQTLDLGGQEFAAWPTSQRSMAT